MTEADCTGVNFSSTNLMGVNMTKAKLNGACLDCNCSLINVNSTDAQLIGASLEKTYWEGTTLLRTRLNDANWTGARLHNMDMGLATGVNLTGIAEQSDDRIWIWIWIWSSPIGVNLIDELKSLTNPDQS